MDRVITVSAYKYKDDGVDIPRPRAACSWGACIDTYAPGVNITVPNIMTRSQYKQVSGDYLR